MAPLPVARRKTQFVFQFGCKLVLVVGEAGPPPCQTKKERISQLREVAATQHRPHGPSLVDSTCMFSIIHGQLLISLKEIVQKETVSMFVNGERYGGSFTLHVSIFFLLGFGWDGH